MDPRGAPSLSPAGALTRLAERAPGGFPHLERARERTRDGIAALAAGLADTPRDPDVAIVLFGSWGRYEVTRGSDEDWVVLVDGAQRERVVAPRFEATRDPSRFGDAVFADALVSHIGLTRDDNRNLTRRMLLALESVAIVGEDARLSAWRRVLAGYLEDVDDFRPPRFFLNDLIRYWRTIAVDFEGKARAEGGAKYVSRLAKLRTSRKVLFAGGLLPILLCHLHCARDMPAFLEAQLTAPATDRIAHAFLEYGAADAGVRALGAYDRWLGMLDDPATRAELESGTREDAPGSAAFREASKLGDDLEAGLLALLFETSLRPLVREYAIF